MENWKKLLNRKLEKILFIPAIFEMYWKTCKKSILKKNLKGY